MLPRPLQNGSNFPLKRFLSSSCAKEIRRTFHGRVMCMMVKGVLVYLTSHVLSFPQLWVWFVAFLPHSLIFLPPLSRLIKKQHLQYLYYPQHFNLLHSPCLICCRPSAALMSHLCSSQACVCCLEAAGPGDDPELLCFHKQTKDRRTRQLETGAHMQTMKLAFFISLLLLSNLKCPPADWQMVGKETRGDEERVESNEGKAKSHLKQEPCQNLTWSVLHHRKCGGELGSLKKASFL